MKKIFFAILLLLVSLVEAKQFTATYESVIDAGSTSQFNVGQPFIIEIVLDNGGDSLISQTWTASDVVSVTFKLNSEPNTITSVFSSVETDTEGNFTTNAAGDLIGVLSEWTTEGLPVDDTLVISTNDEYLTTAYGNFHWFINGLNDVYYTDDGSNWATDLNVENNIKPSHWILSETPTASSSGGGCTYNPNNKGIDMMLILLLLLAASYPLRTRLSRNRA